MNICANTQAMCHAGVNMMELLKRPGSGLESDGV
jgi:hypothetical protein